MNKTEKCMQLQIIEKVLKIKHCSWYDCFLMLLTRSMKVSGSICPEVLYTSSTRTNLVLILVVSHSIFKIENNFSGPEAPSQLL